MPLRYAQKTSTFHWHFDCPVERIWPVLADTERFNEAAKLPKYRVSEILQNDGSVAFFGKAVVGPMSVDWREIPTNWVKNSWFRHERQFMSGPLATLCATLNFYPDGDGCRAEYILSARPRNWFGWILLATTFFSSTKTQFDKLADQAHQFARGQTAAEFNTAPPKLQPGSAELMQKSLATISQSAYGHRLGARLVEFLTTGSEVDVRRIRPLALAKRWGVPNSNVVELCLQAAHDKLLGISWDLLCPRCQGAKAKAVALDQLPLTAHCASCNIDYGRDYAKNVEMTFHPSRRVRLSDDREFCLFGPMTTPHIWVQITVAAGASVAIDDPGLPQTLLRLRTLQPGSEVIVDWQGGNFPNAIADADAIRVSTASRPGVLTFTNTTARPVTFIIDEASWSAEALTADRVISRQAFRDLFDDAILRPGDHLMIDHVTIMFVDLKGSSALYEQAGDVKAYQLVREFFSIAGMAIRQNEGAIVKTAGDAVNAAFSNPRDAFLGAIAIQRAFADYNSASGKEPIISKIGLHMGKTIAVTLNHRLDYYGTAVNFAARLSDLSSGGDIVLSLALADDPSVGSLLQAVPTTRDRATVKGFETPVEFVRVTSPDALPADELCANVAA